jgi:hypothetical protein
MRLRRGEEILSMGLPVTPEGVLERSRLRASDVDNGPISYVPRAELLLSPSWICSHVTRFHGSAAITLQCRQNTGLSHEPHMTADARDSVREAQGWVVSVIWLSVAVGVRGVKAVMHDHSASVHLTAPRHDRLAAELPHGSLCI